MGYFYEQVTYDPNNNLDNTQLSTISSKYAEGYT